MKEWWMEETRREKCIINHAASENWMQNNYFKLNWWKLEMLCAARWWARGKKLNRCIENYYYAAVYWRSSVFFLFSFFTFRRMLVEENWAPLCGLKSNLPCLTFNAGAFRHRKKQQSTVLCKKVCSHASHSSMSIADRSHS